ncbi:MAG TPA: GIY-YIG nuclease family protein [Candidatus Nanoarchaeia archaeon]|nr:GIY-YIG nuclease family protein [Candidatus Nanoarchaeia archaeon]
MIPEKSQSSFFVYILECDDNTYYTGYTNNLIKRVAKHKLKKGAKYTRSKKGMKLVYFEIYPTKEQAMKREYEIKRAGRIYKQILVKNFRINLEHFKDDLLWKE